MPSVSPRVLPLADKRLALPLLALLAGCLPSLADSDFARGLVAVPGPRPSAAGVEITYLGVGGWLVDTGSSQLLTAPFFSNPGLFRAGFASIAPYSMAIERALEHLDVPDLSDVRAILVGHGHYDHLMDVPYLASRHAPRARILGNRSVRLTLAPFEGPDLDASRIVDVSGSAASVEGGGAWIEVAPDLRVLPLLSDHAPHFAGRTLYGGDRGAPLTQRPRAADEWLEGETLAYLIDVLDGAGDVRLRIYYQDAVSREPLGLIPPELAPVDVALIVPATFAEVDWHPEAIMENTLAAHVLLGHWEDFFRPATDEPEPVPFTILPEFVARLRRALDGDEGRWHLPVAGARFRWQER